jgi:methionyl aminopeptidase
LTIFIVVNDIRNLAKLVAGRHSGITIKSDKEMGYMRDAGAVVALTKAKLSEAIRPGITTVALDRIAEQEIRRLGAKPSFKGYLGFPATICVSLNEQIVHGIPSHRKLKEGDIVSLDVGAIVDGFHSDSAFTVGVGEISEDAQRLIYETRESLRLGIAQARSGARVGDISEAVQKYGERQGYGVVRQYVGHGIGRALHEDPQVPNYGARGTGPLLREGMALAVEPMFNIGGWETSQLDDGWTVVTADGTLSAHFEDTIAITASGADVLTAI